MSQYPDPDYSEPQPGPAGGHRYPPPGQDFPPVPARPLFPPPNVDPPAAYPPAASAYPPVGYPPVGQYPPAPAHHNGYPPLPPGTNGMAVAALITSILGALLCFLPAMLGLVFGLVALNQIKRTGEQGRGMAITGVVIGGLATALVVVWAVLMTVGAVGGWA